LIDISVNEYGLRFLTVQKLISMQMYKE